MSNVATEKNYPAKSKRVVSGKIHANAGYQSNDKNYKMGKKRQARKA